MLRRISARSQFAGFLVAGGIAAAANFFARIAFNVFLSYATSIVLAYLVGMATAFVLNRRAVFAPSGKAMRSEVVWFTLVNVLAVAQTLLISLLLADVVFPAMEIQALRHTLAHAVGIIVPVITSYYGHRHWTFAKRAGGAGKG